MFANLMRSELTRLLLRRRTRLSLLAMLMIGIVTPMLWMPNEGPLTQAEIAEARLLLEEIRVDCPDCTLVDMLRTPWTYSDVVQSLSSGALVLALVTFLIVVTYVGSDFSSGALATQLTFTPQRRSVLAARTLGASLLGGVLLLASLVVATVVSTVWFLALFGYGSVGSAEGVLELLGGTLLYGLMLGAGAALLVFCCNGAALGAAAGIVAVLFGYVAETVAWSGRAYWLLHASPSRQGWALLRGVVDVDLGYDDLGGVTSITRLEALGYHASLLVVLAAAATLLFERRDIKG